MFILLVLIYECSERLQCHADCLQVTGHAALCWWHNQLVSQANAISRLLCEYWKPSLAMPVGVVHNKMAFVKIYFQIAKERTLKC